MLGPGRLHEISKAIRIWIQSLDPDFCYIETTEGISTKF